jgi:pyrroline-5-carboxylate reductase
MARAIVGGLRQAALKSVAGPLPRQTCPPGGPDDANAATGGHAYPAANLCVVDPNEVQRALLQTQWGVATLAQPDASLAQAQIVVWAVKPQAFAMAAAACAGYLSPQALHVSVMAGVRTSTIAQATGNAQVVRAMPNTPALIGQGMTALFAGHAVTSAQRSQAAALLQATGQLMWLDDENQLDAVTALSGSGPAYVFYFLETMMQAAQEMGLSAEQGRQLALRTFAGATELAERSEHPPKVLREQVTSKGGTTFAALQVLEAQQVSSVFKEALRAAQNRARELGDELDAPSASAFRA